MTLFGWDASHFDAPTIGNAVAEGFSFFTHKAGGDANDAEIATWWNSVKNTDPAKVILGAYWVLYPGHGSGAGDSFVARLNATCPGWQNRPFILQLDCEKWNGDSGTIPSKGEIKAACDRLVALMPKLKPIVYAPEWVYSDTLSGLAYPLWASSYVSGTGTASALYPGDNSSKWHAYSGQTPAVLQFTSSATIAGQTTCDANAFRGSLQELVALVAPGWMENFDMPLTNDDVQLILSDDSIPNLYSDQNTNPNITVRTALKAAGSADVKLSTLAANVSTLQSTVNALQTAVNTLLARPAAEVDEAALAAALAPLLNVQEEEIKSALASVLRGGTDSVA